ncbi:MAG: DUF4301 family protein [Rikenellaceae bacterium]|jgi:hypothetical protein|nr:DUF4301 family protein [Rikenellaceae bacterium]
MFTEKELQQLEGKGIGADQVEQMLKNFRQGFPYLPITAAAVASDGIRRFPASEVESRAIHYDQAAKGLTVEKFVPASGAATRMFKDFFEFVADGKPSKCVDDSLKHLSQFAFYDELKKYVAEDARPREVIAAIVGKGLGYGSLPKGLLLFHRYGDGNRTALEEHLAEGAMYASSGDGTVRIHFTVSPEHQAGFEQLVERVRPVYEKKFGVKYLIAYSQQKPSTDTLAADMHNEPFREADGTLLFRPGGHGALIENLDEIDADVIFVKNIDNVVPDHRKGDTVLWKKAIADLLLDVRDKSFAYLRKLDAGADDALLAEIEKLVAADLSYKLPADFSKRPAAERAAALHDRLDRPIRVCGMVKNEGEPGGGPFWVAEPDGARSLQIAESSQIAPEQAGLMREATHFNPVDLVCLVKDYKGKMFDLKKYVDPQTGFISVKSKNGRELKAQELPGLWNGAMARWNTLFVEVPVSTFNPVKSVADLLRPQHQ